MIDELSNELRTLGQKWADAERAGDVATLDELLSAEFRGVGPLGFVLTKEGWLARYRSGDLSHKAFEWTAEEVRTFGDSAVVIGIQTQETTYQGRPVDGGQLRVTQVLVRDHRTWRLASVHIGNLVDAAAARGIGD
jgi:ketosteroid isomerase-like protein